MPKDRMPQGSDVEQIIRSMGLFATDDLTTVFELMDTATFAAAAVSQWERETGWQPFLANLDEDAEDEVRYFDPQGANFRPQLIGGGYGLDLSSGIVTLVSVNSGWSEDDDGTLLVVPTDVRIYPYNATQTGVAQTMLQFTVPQWGLRHSLRVTGRFGWGITVPDDVWLAISHQAVSLALPEIATRITGGMIEWKEADASERYGEAFLIGDKGIGSVWKLEWQRATNRYKRIVI